MKVMVSDWPSAIETTATIDEPDPDDTPNAVVIEGLRQGLHESITGQAVTLSQMWDSINAD